MDMWTASAEPDHISTAPATTTPHIKRRRRKTTLFTTLARKEATI